MMDRIPEEAIDPLDSIETMVKKEDLQKFVLFKTHYDTYMGLQSALDEVTQRLADYAEEIDRLRSQEEDMQDDVSTLRSALHQRDLQCQRREDELFSADEKISQLECELEEERSACHRLKAEKESLESETRSLKHERNELQLRLRIAQSKSAEEASTREAATRRLEQYYEDASKEKERWRGEFMDLFNRVKSLEAQWRSCSELQAVIRHGIQHLAVCMKTNCKHCIVVQEATSPMHLSSPGATATLQTRKQQARWLRLQFQELTSAFSTLLPDCPHRLLWEGSPGVSYSSDESNGGNEDSGFEDKDDESRRSFVRQVWQRRSHPVGNGAGGSSLYRPAATHEHHRSYVAVAGPSDETSARRKAGGALWRMLQRISMRKKPLPPSPVAGE